MTHRGLQRHKRVSVVRGFVAQAVHNKDCQNLQERCQPRFVILQGAKFGEIIMGKVG